MHEPSYLSLYTTGLIPAAISAWFAGAADASGPWAHLNDRWSLDFAADQSIDGRRLLMLVVVDDCTHY